MVGRRRTGPMRVLVAGLACAVCAAQEVEMAGPEPLTVVPRQTRLYADVTPTLRIQGTGFNGDGKNLHLAFVPALAKDAFSVTVTSPTALSVQLKGKYRWPLPTGASEAIMYLTSLKNDLNDDPDAELITDAVPVAAVLGTPSIVRRDDRVIYMSGSKILYINGTNFRPKETTFWFDPPLFKETDYSMVVTSNGIAQLTLNPGRSWRSDKVPGPLKIKRLDTGAGALRIDAKYGGVTVAEVQVDLGAHGVTVETTSDKRFYQSSPKLTILGNGFNDTGIKGANTLRWANSLRGRGVNYTIVEAARNQLILELAEGSKWRANPANLPGPLTLLAVNAGAGPVPVGATNAKKGRQIATIYADPKIYENGDNATKLYRTLSHELWIVGEGFVKSGTQMTLRAKAPDGTVTNLRSLVDYMLLAFNSTHVRVWLEDGKAWAPTADSTLEVVSLDTGAGPFPKGPTEEKPVTVAIVVADAEQTTAMQVTRTLTTQTLYETPAKKSLMIEGEKLCDTGKVVTTSDVKLVFDPVVSDDVFTVESVKPTKITLNLVKGHKWPVGALKVISIQCSNKADPVVFTNGEGVAVATVLANPVVEVHEDLTLYAHHSKRLVIRGSGFSVDSTTLTLDPAPAKDTTPYKVVECLEDFIALELTDDSASWIPESMLPAKDSEDKVPLKVTAIDTGAGEVSFQDDPPVVAQVVDEPEGDFCDDSCEWAHDGVCDDGTQPFILEDDAFAGSSSGYGGNRWGGRRPYDDDLGGFRYDDDDDIYGYGDEYAYGFYFDRGYDDYGAGWIQNYDARGDDDASAMAACPRGTDCTDCQPRAGDGRLKDVPDAVCDNTCNYARDGYCDDGRDNMPAYCDPGTDCQDCGPVGADNFTRYDDEFWDDDGENFYFQDDYWDDYDRQYWRDDDFYGYYDDMAERISSSDGNGTGVSSSSGSSKSSNDKKKTSYLDDDGPVKGYVRSQANPFEIDPAVASAGDDSLASLLLAGVFVAVLALAACGALRYAGPHKGKRGGLLPCFNRKAKEDTSAAKDLAGAWADMTARRDNNEKSSAPVPITPDVHFSGAKD